MDLVDDGRGDHSASADRTGASRVVAYDIEHPADDIPSEASSSTASSARIADGLAIASLVLAVASALGPSTWFYWWSMRSNGFGGAQPGGSPVRTFLELAGGHLVFAVTAMLLGSIALTWAPGDQPRWVGACARGGVVTALVVILLVAAGALFSYVSPPTGFPNY